MLLSENFLLPSALSRRLYEGVRDLPIIDFHNHLDLTAPPVSGITELWLAADPYKHRLMRMHGVPERLITGDAPDREKFAAWCGMFPMLVGTPVYDWCLMELQLLGCDTLPSAEHADALREQLDAAVGGMDTAAILAKFNVAYASPVASVLDDVSHYAADARFAPSLRGDDAAAPDAAFCERLAQVSGVKIATLDDYFAALDARIDAFIAAGCRFADHALDDGFAYIADDGKNPARFAAMLAGAPCDAALTSHILRHLGGEYGRRGLTMQLHLGAMRKTSTRLRTLAGKAGGYAAIGSVALGEIVRLLDDIEKISLPRTILFPLDPSQTEAAAVLAGSFSKEGVRAVVSEGPAWWWCDHRDGIRRVLDAIAAYASIDTFVGMTTDSRRVLSFVRHDYFRRIFCSWLADKAERGEFVCGEETLAAIAARVCCENARAMV